MKLWSTNDDLFFRELKIGYAWQSFAAEFFRASGLSVDLPTRTVRESIDKAGEWTAGDVDLLVSGMVVEVKSRRVRFTSPTDFPYEQPFIDTVAGYEAKNPKPVAYVFVSQITGAMVAFATYKEPKMRVVKRHDRVRDLDERFYVCNRSDLRTMDKLVEHLRREAELAPNFAVWGE